MQRVQGTHRDAFDIQQTVEALGSAAFAAIGTHAALADHDVILVLGLASPMSVLIFRHQLPDRRSFQPLPLVVFGCSLFLLPKSSGDDHSMIT